MHQQGLTNGGVATAIRYGHLIGVTDYKTGPSSLRPLLRRFSRLLQQIAGDINADVVPALAEVTPVVFPKEPQAAANINDCQP